MNMGTRLNAGRGPDTKAGIGVSARGGECLETGQGRLLIGPQVTNLPHKAAITDQFDAFIGEGGADLGAG